MWNAKLIVVLTFYLFVALNSLSSQWQVYGQMDDSNNIANNDAELVVEPTDNTSAGPLNNATHIMENTSGIIDDAFDALKDTFKSFFGK
jgi:hypothetical protein